jgi:hypothetical protein
MDIADKIRKIEALIGGALVICSFLFFFGTENSRVHIIINALFIVYIALMIYAVALFNDPFRSKGGIKPNAYRIVLNYYSEDREKGISPEEELDKRR